VCVCGPVCVCLQGASGASFGGTHVEDAQLVLGGPLHEVMVTCLCVCVCVLYMCVVRVYVYVCVCVYTHTHIHTYTHTYVHIHKNNKRMGVA
jgi:hypothetical protein